jgi:hypothetical protein
MRIVSQSIGMLSMMLGALLAVGTMPAAAQSQRVDGQVLVVLAKEEAGSIDPALRNEPALRRPPFNSFRSMEIIERPSIRLSAGDPVEVKLPNDRRLRVELQQVLPDGRFKMKVSINRPDQNDYLPLLTVVASPGDPFFVAGQSYKGGTLVIGVRAGKKPDR